MTTNQGHSLPLLSYWLELRSLIESGLSGDTEQVRTDAIHLAARFEAEENGDLAAGIRELLDSASTSRQRRTKLTTAGSVETLVQSAITPEARLSSPPSLPATKVLRTRAAEVLDLLVSHRSDRESLGVEKALLITGPWGSGKTTAANLVAESLDLGVERIDLGNLLHRTPAEILGVLREIDAKSLASRSTVLVEDLDISTRPLSEDTVDDSSEQVKALGKWIGEREGATLVIATASDIELIPHWLLRRFDLHLPLNVPSVDDLNDFICSNTTDYQPLPNLELAVLARDFSYQELSATVETAKRYLKHARDSIPVARYFTIAILRRIGKVAAGDIESIALREIVAAIDETTDKEMSLRRVGKLAGCSATYVGNIRNRSEDVT